MKPTIDTMAPMKEKQGPKLTLQQIGEIAQPSYISIEGKNLTTGYTYNFAFMFDHPKGPYIIIDTERRSDFLVKGSEQQAQAALVDLTQQTRRRSGGVLSVHPFYGAVWGTKLTPVAPGFLTDMEELDKTLTMFVHLTDIKDQFDEKLTREALAIGMVVEIPGPKSNRLFEYMRAAPKANPNQSDRDQAIVNGLGKRWNAEFKKYHQENVPPAMTLSTENIVLLMRKLESEAGITDLKVESYSQK